MILLLILLFAQILSGKIPYDSKLQAIEKHSQKNPIYLKLKPHLSNIDLRNYLSEKYQIRIELTKLGQVNNRNINTNSNDDINRIYRIDNHYTDKKSLIQTLRNTGIFQYVEMPGPRNLFFIPNDEHYVEYQEEYLNLIGLPQVWDIINDNANILIAIIDSGTKLEHPDLSTNIFINPMEILDGIDNDNNDKIDDISGWDFVGNEYETDSFEPDNSPQPTAIENNHGTHVAGIVGARYNNSIGIAGVGCNVKILPIKIGYDDSHIDGTLYFGFEAMLYAADMGAKIINCSWGGFGYSQFEQDIIDHIVSRDIVIVASAGNHGINADDYPLYPAAYNGVISVGATNLDIPVSYSNGGCSVDILAPGHGIYSTIQTGPNEFGYDYNYGTSMAAPIVSGILGLTFNDKFTNKFNYQKLFLEQVVKNNSSSISNNLKIPGMINGLAILNSSFRGISIDQSLQDNSTNVKIDGISHDLQEGDQVLLNIVSNDSLVSNFMQSTSVTINSNSFLHEFEPSINQKGPWQEGHSNFVIETNCNQCQKQYFTVPYKFKIDGNAYLTDFGMIKSEFAYSINDISFYDFDKYYFVGTEASGGKGVIYSPDFEEVKNLGLPPLSSIYAFNSDSLFITTIPENDNPLLINTTDDFESIKTYQIGHITKYPTKIYFFDEQRGILIGDPVKNEWGIALTDNFGKNWTQISLPAKENDETQPSAFFANDSFVAFGTKLGNIYFSDNGGMSWDVLSLENQVWIHRLAFDKTFQGYLIASAAENDFFGRRVFMFDKNNIHTDSKEFQLANSNSIKEINYKPTDSNFVFIFENGGIVQKRFDSNNESYIKTLKTSIYDSFRKYYYSKKSNEHSFWSIGNIINKTSYHINDASTDNFSVNEAIKSGNNFLIQLETKEVEQFTDDSIKIELVNNGENILFLEKNEKISLAKTRIKPNETVSFFKSLPSIETGENTIDFDLIVNNKTYNVTIEYKVIISSENNIDTKVLFSIKNKTLYFNDIRWNATNIEIYDYTGRRINKSSHNVPVKNENLILFEQSGIYFIRNSYTRELAKVLIK